MLLSVIFSIQSNISLYSRMEDNISKGDNCKISKNGSVDTFKRDNPVEIALFLSEKESIFKRKNWLLVVYRKANRKSQKLSLFSKMAEKSTKYIQSP